MARKNEQVERLEAKIEFMERGERARRQPPGDIPVTGCGDSSCEVSPPTGQHTNGGCRCDERTLRRALRWQKRRADFMTVTIEDMRKDAIVIEQAQREADAQRYTWDRDKAKASPDLAAEFETFDAEARERMAQMRTGK